ncbi:MAG: transglutaminase family protein, partial [Pontibacterium sp.]
GEYVAGVRYRAWSPPSALHPTLGVDAPLVFDLVDTWTGHSIGGCTYHVVHQGGRNYDTMPVNSFEAEARRVKRFDEFGHSPGHLPFSQGMAVLREFFPNNHPPRPMAPVAKTVSAEYPNTLDLRRELK